MPKNYFIHNLSDVKTADIGSGTSIWQYCVILPNAKIGKNCNICSHVFIENDVVIGDNVTIKNGVQIWDAMRVENNVFIGPNATFGNDIFPRSIREQPRSFKPTEVVIESGASIGGGAIILPGITIGKNAMIAAGAIITSDVEPNSIYIGKKAQYHKEVPDH